MLSLRLATRACGQREPFSDEAPVRSSRCQWGWACHPGLHPKQTKHLLREEEVAPESRSSQVESSQGKSNRTLFSWLNLTRAGSVFNTTRTDPKHGGRYRMDGGVAD